MKVNPVLQLLTIAVSVLLVACGTPEERADAYLEEARSQYEDGDLVKAKLSVRNCLQLEPRNSRARYLYAQILEVEQDVRGVLANLQVAIDEDPDYLDARVKLAGYFVVGRGADQAREQVDAALAIAPEDPRVRLLNARLMLLEGDADAALAEAQSALAAAPERAEIAGFTALMLARRGELNRGLAVLDRAISAADADAVEYLRNARISLLAEAGDRERGLQALEEMVRDYPGTPRYRLALAELYVARGRVDDAEKLIEALIAGDPDNAQWRIRLAGLLAGADRVEEAERQLRDASKVDPESMRLRFALASLYETAGRRVDAIALYEFIAGASESKDERLAAKNRMAALNAGIDDERARALLGEVLAEAPDNVDALLTRAAYRIGEGDTQGAIGDLRAALSRQPDSARALLGLARAYVIDGNALLAEETYRSLLALQPANRNALRELGALVGNQGNPAEAETLLREALRQGEGDTEASRNLVRALLQQQDYDAAATEARRMAAAGEPTGVADFQLGLALEGQGSLDEAATAYRSALDKSPLADEPLLRLVRLYLRDGQAAEAETYLLQHLREQPDHVRAQLLLAEVYSVQARTGDSSALYRKMIARDPGLVAAYIGLAALADDTDGRIAPLQDGFAVNPQSSELALALGASYSKQGRYAQAIAVYERAIEARDNDLIATNLAALLLDQRDDAASHEQALQLAERFANGEQHPFNHGVLGWALHKNGDSLRAVRYLEQAVAAAPDVAQLHYYLGMAYLAMGNEVNARQSLGRSVELAERNGSPFTGLDQARREVAALEARESA